MNVRSKKFRTSFLPIPPLIHIPPTFQFLVLTANNRPPFTVAIPTSEYFLIKWGRRPNYGTFTISHPFHNHFPCFQHGLLYLRSSSLSLPFSGFFSSTSGFGFPLPFRLPDNQVLTFTVTPFSTALYLIPILLLLQTPLILQIFVIYLSSSFKILHFRDL